MKQVKINGIAYNAYTNNERQANPQPHIEIATSDTTPTGDQRGILMDFLTEQGIDVTSDTTTHQCVAQLIKLADALNAKRFGKFDSWTVESNLVCSKKCDKSFFGYNGSGIPADVRWFFGIDKLEQGEKKNFTFILDGKEYSAYVQREKIDLARTRLFWESTLGEVFKEYDNPDNYPTAQFTQVDDTKYEIKMLGVVQKVDIDYIGVLDYLRDNAEIPYSNPEAEGIDADEKQRLIGVKEKGQFAVGEMKKMTAAFAKRYKLTKCLPMSWLDGSNTKTRKYLWAQMKYDEASENPTSISIFVEKNGETSTRYRISLEIKNDGTDKKTMAKYHSHLEIPLNTDAGLVYVAGSNEWGHPAILSDSQDAIKAKVASGELRKVQVCKYVERKPEETNEYFHSEVTKAIEALLPYYEHTLGIKPKEIYPSLDEYDPGITAEQYEEILSDKSIIKYEWMDILYYLYKLGGEATCKQIANAYGNGAPHYNSNAINIAKAVAKETQCPLMTRENGGTRYWPVLFFGYDMEDLKEGQYCYIMREPLKTAISNMIEDGYFEGISNMSVKEEFDKNLILYGPPGTGKTYNTAIYAVAICDGKSIDELTDYDAVMARYNELKAQHRVAFTTFHQSYGYEEFIEGIKPVVDGNSSDVSYTIESGVFKKFCETAKVVQEDDVEYTGKVWTVRNRAGDKDVSADFEEKLYEDGVIKIEDINDHKRQCGFLNDMVPGDWIVLGRNYNINAIGVIIDEAPEDIEDGVFHYQRRVEWKATGLSVDCKAINRGKCFSNFAIAQSWMKVQDLQKLIDGDTKNEQPYVFIVDEINRGNISKIFGELITLIENTKREGMPEAASAILPYSGESFSVPSNVYILGTMNTADRSIALMDTALRRRFQFVEMMPDADVLRAIGADKVKASDVELDVAAMLEAINERISFLYDREHTIGHAFFTGLKDDPSVEKLASIFAKSVIPLLQEYFYEDYQKIQLVLGDNGKTDESHKFIKDVKVVAKNIFKGSVDDVIDLPEKKYEVNDDALMNIQSYIEIM